MVPYFGDFPTSATVYIPINTFDSNDPAASVTATNLANTDVHIHKDGGTTQRNNAAGITMTIDYDSITGNHLLIIDTSDNTVADFYQAGHEYQVRVEGVTVDGGTLNSWVGSFSIERAGGALALLKSATYGLSAIETLVDDLETRVTDARMGALTDLIDGGRLDLLFDAMKTKTDGLNFTGTDVKATLDGEEVTPTAASKTGYTLAATTGLGNQTANITGNLSGSVGSVTGAVGSVTGNVGGNVTGSVGSLTGFNTTGSGLSAIPWNAAWDAEVQSECDDAITASGIKGATFDTATDSLEALRNRGDAAWATATGFSTHSAADVKTAIEAAGSSIALILADTGELQTNQGNWLTATGFSTHNAEDVVAALDDGATLTACVTATGFSTHSASDVKTAIEADGSALYELLQRHCGKVVIDRDNSTIKYYKANGTDLIATLTMATVGNVDTITRS